jgi:hypothetical protein
MPFSELVKLEENGPVRSVIKPSLITEDAVVPPLAVDPPPAADELGELLLLHAATPPVTRATAVAIAITVVLFLIVMVKLSDTG